jgi:hypothetical protein
VNLCFGNHSALCVGGNDGFPFKRTRAARYGDRALRLRYVRSARRSVPNLRGYGFISRKSIIAPLRLPVSILKQHQSPSGIAVSSLQPGQSRRNRYSASTKIATAWKNIVRLKISFRHLARNLQEILLSRCARHWRRSPILQQTAERTAMDQQDIRRSRHSVPVLLPETVELFPWLAGEEDRFLSALRVWLPERRRGARADLPALHARMLRPGRSQTAAMRRSRAH